MQKGQSLKILIIGPLQAGKSTISNFLADREEVQIQNYRPTAGLRILEFQKEAPRNPKRPGAEKVMIELWDVSGDPKYDHCWPAIQKDAHGIIFVYNAENPKHEQELEGWVNSFPKKANISASLCVAFAHHLNGKPIKGTSKLSKGLSNLICYDTSVEEGASRIMPAFDKFFSTVMLNLYEKQEKEENNLID